MTEPQLKQEVMQDIVLMKYVGMKPVIVHGGGPEINKALRKQGIESLLPRAVTLVSGPGCPVCVTPSGYIDNALRLVTENRAVVATFGDLVKVATQ